jgi:phasin family protein
MANKGPKNRVSNAAAPQPPFAAAGAEAEPITAPTLPTPVAEATPVIETAIAIAAAEPMIEVAKVTPEIVETAVAEATANTNQTAEPAAATADKDLGIMAITFENSVEKSQAMFADMNDRTKAAVEKSTKLVEDFNDFAKGNVEALVESGRITAKGIEALGQEAADYSRRSFESTTAALKSMASVKSPTDFFKLQSDFLRTSFDSYVAGASRGTEAMLKLAGDAVQPLQNRVAVAVEKAKIAA